MLELPIFHFHDCRRKGKSKKQVLLISEKFLILSGQFTIVPKPELREFGGFPGP